MNCVRAFNQFSVTIHNGNPIGSWQCSQPSITARHLKAVESYRQQAGRPARDDGLQSNRVSKRFLMSETTGGRRVCLVNFLSANGLARFDENSRTQSQINTSAIVVTKRMRLLIEVTLPRRSRYQFRVNSARAMAPAAFVHT